MVAFSRRRRFRAQVHFNHKQTLVLSQRRDLLGQLPAIAGAMDRSYLR